MILINIEFQYLKNVSSINAIDGVICILHISFEIKYIYDDRLNNLFYYFFHIMFFLQVITSLMLFYAFYLGNVNF